ncbi:MAG: DUF3078 domain-containing protein [Bacteroidota bacterium]
MRFIIQVASTFISIYSVIAQQNVDFNLTDSLRGWNSMGTTSLNFSNVGFSNWSGGGESALSLSGDLEYQFLYVKEKIVFENEINLIYGVTRIDGFNWFRKTDDQFTLRSLYGKRLSKRSYITLLTEFWTQMSNGFEYDDDDNQERKLVSRVLAPGYISSNLGFTAKKQDHYAITLSPFTGKLTMVLDDSLSTAGAFGVNPGEHLRFEGGTIINGNFSVEFMQNTIFKISANLFSNYNDFSTVDVNLTSFVRMNVNNLLSFKIFDNINL